MTKQQTIEVLKQQLPGFYSVEQVIQIINDIETPSSISVEKLEKLKALIADKVSFSIQNMSSDEIIDYDSIELSLDYNNRIEIGGGDVNGDNIVDQVMGSVDAVLMDFFEDKEDDV